MRKKKCNAKIYEFINLTDNNPSNHKNESTVEEKRLIFFLLALTCITLAIVTNVKVLPTIFVCLLLSSPGLKATLCKGKTRCYCEQHIWLSLCITSALTSILLIGAYIYFQIIRT